MNVVSKQGIFSWIARTERQLRLTAFADTHLYPFEDTSSRYKSQIEAVAKSWIKLTGMTDDALIQETIATMKWLKGKASAEKSSWEILRSALEGGFQRFAAEWMIDDRGHLVAVVTG